MTIAIILLYFLSVLSIGVFGHRLFRGTGEDFFVASRSIGPFVLFMTLFGTNMTAFSMLGASGEAYRKGIGIFALMGSSSALVIPLLYYSIGTRLWWLGKREGYLTQVQFLRDRYQSDLIGLLLFVILVVLMIPYILIGVMGGGLALADITAGQIPAWLGSLMMCLVIFLYVTTGGMRSTAWANTFQTLCFMTFGLTAVIIILNELGGLSSAMSQVGQTRPDMLVVTENIKPLEFVSYLLVPLSVGTFPHIFSHWLSAKSAKSFQLCIVLYPACIVIVWISSVTLGVLGHIDFPELSGGAVNTVMIKEINQHAHGVIAGFLAAGVFAAIMSSLDSQVLAIGTMFTQDIIGHYRVAGRLSERPQVWFGRVFIVSILIVVYVLSLVVDRSIFKLATWSLTGFTSLLPLVVAALYWRRSTKQGVLVAIVVVATLWTYYFVLWWRDPNYTIGGSGLLPVAVILAASTASVVVVSLLTSAPEPERIERFFPSNS